MVNLFLKRIRAVKGEDIGNLFGIATLALFFAVMLSCLISSCEQTCQAKIMKVTAYCPCKKCCGKNANGITASGHKTVGRFCAGPNNIPFGTLLTIPGYGRFPVWDRGGNITEGRLDVFFPTHKEALQWGIKYLEVKEIK